MWAGEPLLCFKGNPINPMWWCTYAHCQPRRREPVPGRLPKFQVSLDYVVRPCIKQQQKQARSLPLVLAFWSQRQENFSEFKASLVYIESSRTAWATQRSPILKKRKIKKGRLKGNGKRKKEAPLGLLCPLMSPCIFGLGSYFFLSSAVLELAL